MLRTIPRSFLFLFASAAFSACAVQTETPPAQAETTEQKAVGDLEGWAYFDGTTLPAYRSYNSTGATNSVFRVFAGRYNVTFPGLGAAGIEGNVQVTAAGGGNERCTINDWFESSGNIDVDVGCHTPAGDWSDSPFVVSFVKLPGGAALSADGAYLRTDPGGAALSPGFQWGAPITESHPATGQYQITLGGVSSLGGTVVVTTYGWSRAYCKPANWVVDGADTKINVRCFDPGGAATDTGFSLRYIRHTRDSRFGSGGFVWANQPTALDYIPSPIYQENRLASECGDHFFTNNAHRVAKGRYQITYPSQMVDVPPSGAALVTAYGSGNEYCKLTNWEAPSSIPGAVRIGTRCFDATGSLVDTRFTEVYFSQAFLIC